MPLAQKETIDFLLGGFYARHSIEQVVDLAWGPLFCGVPLCFVLSHEKRLLSLPTAPGIPCFAGPSPKEEGDSKKRLHTHSTLTDIKRPQAITVCSKHLVYQVLSGVSVSRDTLCLMTPPIVLEDDSMPVWDVGRRARRDGRGTRSEWLGITRAPYPPRAARAVRSDY